MTLCRLRRSCLADHLLVRVGIRVCRVFGGAECKENLALNVEDKGNADRIDRINKILLML